MYPPPHMTCVANVLQVFPFYQDATYCESTFIYMYPPSNIHVSSSSYDMNVAGLFSLSGRNLLRKHMYPPPPHDMYPPPRSFLLIRTQLTAKAHST